MGARILTADLLTRFMAFSYPAAMAFNLVAIILVSFGTLPFWTFYFVLGWAGLDLFCLGLMARRLRD